MFEKQVVVDGRGHLLGRLAAVVARELIRGQKVVVVRCEEVNMSGSLVRNEVKFHSYLNKVTRTNPRRGHHHFRSPARLMWRAVRGMLPYKSTRGAEALARLKVFEGVPPPYDVVKRMVVPAALRIKLAPGRKYCVLKDLCSKVGWKYNGIVEKLEEKRKIRSHTFYENKKKKVMKKAVAMKNEKLAKVNAELATYGF